MLCVTGVSGYMAAIFHLQTHAFFKALLFLAAGLIIHGLGGEQDLRQMSSIIYFLPLAYIFLCIGTITILGIAPFSGFFSKELILEYLLSVTQGYSHSILLLIVACLTAFYSYRIMLHIKTTNNYFFGSNCKQLTQTHEARQVNYLIPLLFLALFSFVIGSIETDYLLNTNHFATSYIANENFFYNFILLSFNQKL